MKPIEGYFVIPPDQLHWRPSALMGVPQADVLRRTRSDLLAARFWRLPPKSANALQKRHRAEELFVVLQGTGRIRVDGRTLTVPQYGSVLVGPRLLRQIFNDRDEEVLWLVVAAPEAELRAARRSTRRCSIRSTRGSCPRSCAAWCGPRRTDRAGAKAG